MGDIKLISQTYPIRKTMKNKTIKITNKKILLYVILFIVLTIFAPLGACSRWPSNRGNIIGLEGATFNARFFGYTLSIPHWAHPDFTHHQCLAYDITLVNSLEELYALQRMILGYFNNFPNSFAEIERAIWLDFFAEGFANYTDEFFASKQLIVINNLPTGDGTIYHAEYVSYYDNKLTIHFKHGAYRRRGCNTGFDNYWAATSSIVEITHISQNLNIKVITSHIAGRWR